MHSNRRQHILSLVKEKVAAGAPPPTPASVAAPPMRTQKKVQVVPPAQAPQARPTEMLPE